jgi:hypothetical protein
VSVVTVVIVAVAALADHSGVEVEYEVRNGTRAPIWLVDDGFLAWHESGERLELSYARELMQPGAKPFGYFVPKVARVQAGTSVRRKVQLAWKQRLDRLWNRAREATLAPGEHALTVKIGYGARERPDDPTVGEGVEAPVLRWQHVAVSPSVTLRVP